MTLAARILYRAARCRGPIEERAEGVGGVLCLSCFDKFARERGLYLCWESGPL